MLYELSSSQGVILPQNWNYLSWNDSFKSTFQNVSRFRSIFFSFFFVEVLVVCEKITQISFIARHTAAFPHLKGFFCVCLSSTQAQRSISIIELILRLRGYNSLDLHLMWHRTQTLYIFPDTYLICFLACQPVFQPDQSCSVGIRFFRETKNLSLTLTEPNHRTLVSESNICTPAPHPEHLCVPLMQQINLHNPGGNFPSKCFCCFKWAACNTAGLNGTFVQMVQNMNRQANRIRLIKLK